MYDKEGIMKVYKYRQWEFGKERVLDEADFLFEADIPNMDWGIISHNGKNYNYCGGYTDLSVTFVEECPDWNPEGEEKDYTDEITCPYCNYEFSDSYEFGRGGEDCEEIECGNCGSTIQFQRIISVEYCTEPVCPTEVMEV
jgi:hypothetical protein